MTQQKRITAVLGPTNTGKTHYAIERMLGYRTGVIGLPLRLLAREVYDKIVAVRGLPLSRWSQAKSALFHRVPNIGFAQ